jgi:alpha-galactosidase
MSNGPGARRRPGLKGTMTTRLWRGLALAAVLVASVLTMDVAGQTTNAPGVAPLPGYTGGTNGAQAGTGTTNPPAVAPLVSSPGLPVPWVNGQQNVRFGYPFKIGDSENGYALTVQSNAEGTQVLMQGSLPAYSGSGFNSGNGYTGNGSQLSHLQIGNIDWLGLASGVSNGLASTNLFTAANMKSRTSFAQFPALGFNCWSYMTESAVLTQVTNAASRGWTANGWKYFVLDFGWAANTRDGDGNLQADATAFPHGIAWLANVLHNCGCRLGIYVSASDTKLDGVTGVSQVTTTIADAAKDGALLASWGVDYVKVDWGLATDAKEAAFYSALVGSMDAQCASNNRPRIYVEGVANPTYFWGAAQNWMPELLNSVRLCGDVNGSGYHYTFWQEPFVDSTRNPWITRPGSFNYNNGTVASGRGPAWWTTNDTRAIYAVSATAYQELSEAGAPSATTDQDGAMLFANPEFTALLRDPLVVSGKAILTNGTSQVWTRPLANGDWLVCLWNQDSNSSAVVSCNLTNLTGLTNQTAVVRDIFTRTTLAMSGSVTATVQANGANLYRVSQSSGLTTNILSNGWRSQYINGVLATISPPPVNPVTANLRVWLKADANSYTDGTAQNWPDSSGNANDATGSGTQPVYHTSVLNGMPAYLFTNTTYLTSAYAGTPTDFTMFVVASATGTGTELLVVDKDFTSGAAFSWRQADPQWRTYGKGAYALLVLPDPWLVLCGTRSGTTLYSFGSGTSSNSVACPSGAISATTLTVGASQAHTGNFQGYIAEFLFYDAHLSDADRAAVQQYLRGKYLLP